LRSCEVLLFLGAAAAAFGCVGKGSDPPLSGFATETWNGGRGVDGRRPVDLHDILTVTLS
jgi:hypothetical protein